MRKKLLFPLIAFFILLTFAGSAMAERYIILYKQNNVPQNLVSSIEAAGGELLTSFDHLGIAIARSDNANFSDLMAGDNRVRSVGIEPAMALPDVSQVEFPNSGPTADDWLFNDGLLWGIERVHAPEAWAAGVTGSHNTTVAVIDTGIAWNHPDLAPNVTHVACYSSAGYHEGLWVAGAPCNPYPSQSDHGTHVAGTVAAAFGGAGAVGVGPNLALASYNTFEIIPGCGLCAFSSSRWLAMLDAADRGFQVINMSLGALGRYGQGQGTDGLATFVAADNRIANAVVSAGTSIVASAGNAGLNLNGTLINLPGGLPGIVNVGASGIQPAPRYQPGVSFDVRAFYSNYGAAIDVAAPGGDCGQIGICDPATRPADWFEYLVLSTIVFPNEACAQTASCGLGFGWKAGTSMASPHAAGVVGLIRDENPDLSARQAVNRLQRDADRIHGNRQEFGSGIVDARAAIH
ncbi:S8 family peptidase [Natronospira bacteriovora]|uniref:S8 family serine peptidase n=1 Tax=Natronospira bacteriovora TaxID=3069753 RepID=A0ABU0W3R7_9GAMM|nr:S8 family serine peptidase [Natronospira sp. AB-CW4]MDQ2068666.1 S8 family serine peptidase [Natronospira sp. AB-CW4]